MKQKKSRLTLWNNIMTINLFENDNIEANNIINSNELKLFIGFFCESLAKNYKYLYDELIQIFSINNLENNLCEFIKELNQKDLGSINHPLISNKSLLSELVELIYLFWRKLERYTIFNLIDNSKCNHQSFIDLDNKFNNVILNIYRSIQQKIQGHENHVYRELHSGSNGSFVTFNTKVNLPNKYDVLNKIPFINHILLRTPLIINTKSNKRKGVFSELDNNPIDEFDLKNKEWFCLPCKVGTQLIFFYFNYKYLPSSLALSNLFEIASRSECINKKPDGIVLFGVEDDKGDTSFFYDTKNNLWIGKISDSDQVQYFGYKKKIILTLYNLINISQDKLPLHGSMVKIYLKNGKHKNVVFIGDSGTGKSETIEALKIIGNKDISHYIIIFDDMGYLRINEQNEIVASGSEIGAFIRLDDLDKENPMFDADRAIFFNPDKTNSRVVIPISPYDVIIQEHKIDLLLYANNYTDKIGIDIFSDLNKAKQIFIEGKRQTMQTTEETGISKTFFANPFGPVQRQKECNLLIDNLFKKILNSNIKIGQIYTCLGIEDKKQNIKLSAKKLLELISADKL